MGFPLRFQLGVGDHLRSVAGVLPVDLAQQLHQIFSGPAWANAHRHEIVEAGQLPQAVLPAEFVEPRNAVFAVANQIERGHIDHLRGALQPSHLDVLQEARMILQRQQSQPLASHAERPVAQAA